MNINWSEAHEAKEGTSKEMAEFMTKNILEFIQPIILHRIYLMVDFMFIKIKKDLIK